MNTSSYNNSNLNISLRSSIPVSIGRHSLRKSTQSKVLEDNTTCEEKCNTSPQLDDKSRSKIPVMMRFSSLRRSIRQKIQGRSKTECKQLTSPEEEISEPKNTEINGKRSPKGPPNLKERAYAYLQPCQSRAGLHCAINKSSEYTINKSSPLKASPKKFTGGGSLKKNKDNKQIDDRRILINSQEGTNRGLFLSTNKKEYRLPKSDLIETPGTTKIGNKYDKIKPDKSSQVLIMATKIVLNEVSATDEEVEVLSCQQPKKKSSIIKKFKKFVKKPKAEL